MQSRILPYETFCRLGGWALNSKEARDYVHNDKHDDAMAVRATLTSETEQKAYVEREASRLITSS